jgi:hypothetical protein
MIRCLLIFVVCVCTNSLAQISGFVKDKSTGKLVTGAEVFINNSSLRMLTDKEGAFSLAGLEPGFVDLVVYRKGYDLFKSSIRIQENKEYKLNLDIIPSTASTKSTKVKTDDEWNKNLQWFMRGLLGSGEFASTCKILNPKVLQFQRDGEMLSATSEEPIKIMNPALGFQLNVIVLQFKAKTESSTFQLLVNYEVELSSEYEKQSVWERNRLKAYWGSSRHFFQSLANGTTKDEGFLISDLESKPVNPSELLVEGKISGYKKVLFNHEIVISYQMEATVTGVKSSEEATQSSRMKQLDAINVNAQGILLNNQSVEITGVMANEKLAYYLPIDYAPTESLENEKVDWKNFSLLREKVYLHTDRDYYYPRETIWLKAYIGYSMPELRDTLSQTLYVELLSPDKARIDSKVYQIKEGIAWGDFKLDDNLAPGQYYLRAYTNWMRNYGDSALFVKPIPILKVDENVEGKDQQFLNELSSELSISTNKEFYKAREKVDVDIQVLDAAGKPIVGNVSVSVTDVVVSVPLNTSSIVNPEVLKIESFQNIPNKYLDQIEHFMERGISFRGVVKDSKDKPAPATLQIVQGNMDNLIDMETDEQGEFLVTGVKFFDSLVFAFKPFNQKGKALPKVDIIDRGVPPPAFSFPKKPLDLRKDDAMQRIQNTYQPDQNVTLLKEIEVKSSKLADDERKGNVRVYGEADYVVTGDNIISTAAGTNFLVGLQGRVPGLRVFETKDQGGFSVVSVRLRGGSSSMAGNTEPMILVDGVPFPDVQSIGSLNADYIDRVEVVTRASPQFGSRGANGIIAIYTKSGFSPQNSVKNYLAHKIPGYSTPGRFFSPTYNGDSSDSQNLDFRTTIFWKPDLKTNDQGKATVQFYSADLATKYRIVVEGVTEKGEPVRAVSYITVE